MVTFGEIRLTIADALADVASMDRVDSNGANAKAYSWAEARVVVDYEFAQTARDFVPAYFFDDTEADAVAAVAQAIEDIWDKYPNDVPDKTYWTDPDWPGVVALAKKAHAVMVENDRRHGGG